MTEIIVPANVVGLRYLCDECGQEMKAVYKQSPLHRCLAGHQVMLDKSYPTYDVILDPATKGLTR